MESRLLVERFTGAMGECDLEAIVAPSRLKLIRKLPRLLAKLVNAGRYSKTRVKKKKGRKKKFGVSFDMLNFVQMGGKLFAVVPAEQLVTDFKNSSSYDWYGAGTEYTGELPVLLYYSSG
jgi:hypothetical protein